MRVILFYSACLEKYRMDATVVTKRITEALVSGRKMVFFVGAGISVSPPSQVKDFKQLNLGTITSIGGGLITCKDSELLSQARPEIMLQVGREELGDNIIQSLEMLQGHKPNFNHFLLAEAIHQGNWVFTTNFENLIEDAYGLLTKSEIPRCYSEDNFKDFTRYITGTSSSPLGGYLFKLHGSIEEDKHGLERYNTIIAALNQVGQGLSKYKVQVLEYFLKNYDFCFIGYSCQDDFTVFPALISSKHANTVFWLQYVPKHTIALKQRPEIEEENNILQRKRESGQIDNIDRENINGNQVLLRSAYFFKVLGNTSEFLLHELSALVKTQMKSGSRPKSPRDKFQQWVKTIDEIHLNMFIGRLFDHLGNWDRAENYYGRSMEIAKATSKIESFVRAKSILADLYARQTQIDKEKLAIQMYHECISQFSGKASATAIALKFDIANVERRLGIYPPDLKKWTADMLQGMDLLRKKSIGQYTGCLNILGLAHLRGDQNDLETGLRYSTESRKIKKKIGDKEGEAAAENAISLLLLAQGRQLVKIDQILAKRKFKSAIHHLRNAFDIRIRYGFFRGCAQNYRNMGDAYREMMKIADSSKSRSGYLKKAEQYYENAIRYLDIVKPAPPPGEIVNWKQGIAGLHNEYYKLTNNVREQRRSLARIVFLYKEDLDILHNKTILREITHKEKELVKAKNILEETKKVCEIQMLNSLSQQIDKLLQVMDVQS